MLYDLGLELVFGNGSFSNSYSDGRLMKALVLKTHSSHCDIWWLSLASLGWQIQVCQYDRGLKHSGPDRDLALSSVRENELVIEAQAFNPDVIVYLGGTERCPSVQTFRQLRGIAPTVHICGDASDEPWWPFIERYHEEKCFSVQVSLDGSFEGPIARLGLVLLQPIDPAQCPSPRPWEAREIHCSFVGNTTIQDTPRSRLLQEMQSRGAVQLFGPYSADPHREMMEVMCNSRLTFNVAYKGPGDTKFGVKGRVTECGVAGSCLLEQVGSPTAYWFESDKDYMEYVVAEHAQAAIGTSGYFHQRMAERLRAKVLSEHSPTVFWQKVLFRAGVR